MKKLLVLILSAILIVAFFGCNPQESKYAPNGIYTGENYIFFPSEKSTLHSNELRETFEHYIAEYHPDWTPSPDYEVYNFVDAKTSERYDLDIFQIYQKQEGHVRYFVRHGQDVYRLSSTISRYSACLTNCAITDIDRDGNIEILVGCLVIFDDYDNHSNVYIIDTSTKTSSDITYYDSASYLKENEDGVVSIYNLPEGKTPLVMHGIGGVLHRFYHDRATVLADSPMLNTINFDFKQQSFEASCNLFNIVGTINVIEDKFPYLFKNQFLYNIAFEIDFSMTYLGEPFSYVGASNLPISPSAKFVSDDKIIDDYMISGRWWDPTKHEVVTGQETSVKSNFRWDYEYLNAAGTYDLVISYDVNYNGIYSEIFPDVVAVSVHDQIVIEDFLTITV